MASLSGGDVEEERAGDEFAQRERALHVDLQEHVVTALEEGARQRAGDPY
ncbi:MAG: hypothetical protein U0360_04015 [Dehalococcoidia bacterium]